MRTRAQRLLNAVSRPEVYEEVLIEPSGVAFVLSLWSGESGAPCVVYACRDNAVTDVEGVETVVQDELDRAGDDRAEVDGVGVMHGDLPSRIQTKQ